MPIHMPNLVKKLKAEVCFLSGFLLGIFSGGAKSIVMQISIVILLFSDQISRKGKSFQGGQTTSGRHPLPPLWEKASL